MSANSNASDDIQFHPPNEPSPNYQDTATEPRRTAAFLEISIGYIKNRRSYLDKQPKLASTKEQIRALQEYLHLQFSPTERFIARWILCQKPIVQVAELGAAATYALEAQRFPREVQFENIEEHQALSAGSCGLNRYKIMGDYSTRAVPSMLSMQMQCQTERSCVLDMQLKRGVWFGDWRFQSVQRLFRQL